MKQLTIKAVILGVLLFVSHISWADEDIPTSQLNERDAPLIGSDAQSEAGAQMPGAEADHPPDSVLNTRLPPEAPISPSQLVTRLPPTEEATEQSGLDARLPPQQEQSAESPLGDRMPLAIQSSAEANTSPAVPIQPSVEDETSPPVPVQPSAEGNTSPPIPLGLPNPNVGSPNSDLSGGINLKVFVQCEKMATSVCSMAPSEEKFKVCLGKLSKQDACKQFIAFAQLSNFGVRDDVDVIKHFDAGNIDVIHVTRGGSTVYPGDYFVINNKGEVTNINSGADAKVIDITTDTQYSQLVKDFPKVQLWSIIDQLPQVELPQNGGIRLIFRYQLLNGCINCDLAGYANVAYDFSPFGELMGVKLLSIDELPHG